MYARTAALATQEESDFLDPLREQLGYLGSAKEVHRGRGRALDALQVGIYFCVGLSRRFDGTAVMVVMIVLLALAVGTPLMGFFSAGVMTAVRYTAVRQQQW